MNPPALRFRSLQYTGERFVPWRDCGVAVASKHIRRYAWAIQHVYGKWVVDLGCGTGYGSCMLSWVARYVYGVDRDHEAIQFASDFPVSNLQFSVYDLDKIDTSQLVRLDLLGDVFVAFDVLEHLDHPEKVISSLHPLIWSMPVGDGSKFHKRPYSVAEIQSLLPGPKWVQTNCAFVPLEESDEDPDHIVGITYPEEL